MSGTPCFQHDNYRADCSDCWHDDEPEPHKPTMTTEAELVRLELRNTISRVEFDRAPVERKIDQIIDALEDRGVFRSLSPSPKDGELLEVITSIGFMNLTDCVAQSTTLYQNMFAYEALRKLLDALTRAALPPSRATEVTEARVGDTERQLPEASHWNGFGKYGPAICLDECTLHIMSRGFGAKDGDGYLTFDPNKFDWERDDEGGEYMVVPLHNSDLLFVRDQLNKLFPEPPLAMSAEAPRGEQK